MWGCFDCAEAQVTSVRKKSRSSHQTRGLNVFKFCRHKISKLTRNFSLTNKPAKGFNITMNEITLKNDGFLENRDKKVEGEPLIYLGFKVSLDEDYTLRSCFRMLEKYELLAKLNPFCGFLMEQYGDAPESGCRFDGIESIEVGKTVEMIGFPGEPRIEIYSTVVGKSGDEAFEIKPFALENLLDVNVKLGRLKHVMLGDKIDQFKFDTVINLFEFIDGIMWELSFHNIPRECRISF